MHINLFAQVFFAANMFVMTLFCAYRRLFSPALLASIFSALPFAALFIYECRYVCACRCVCMGGSVGGGSLTVFGCSRKVVKRFSSSPAGLVASAASGYEAHALFRLL